DDGNTPLHLLVATTPALPIHGCFFKLPKFLKRHKNLDVRVFNNKNLTAGDTIACNDNLHHVVSLLLNIYK
ncbi:hypothetical protein, partial [Klebsiella pneumoniae]|uniref:hypothetical protein n=1 Tax=Klebsiella pneumoniae TaxID=573 RepID=UPI0027301D2F